MKQKKRRSQAGLRPSTSFLVLLQITHTRMGRKYRHQGRRYRKNQNISYKINQIRIIIGHIAPRGLKRKFDSLLTCRGGCHTSDSLTSAALVTPSSSGRVPRQNGHVALRSFHSLMQELWNLCLQSGTMYTSPPSTSRTSMHIAHSPGLMSSSDISGARPATKPPKIIAVPPTFSSYKEPSSVLFAVSCIGFTFGHAPIISK